MEYYTFPDLSNFFIIALADESPDQLAFNRKGQQWTFRVLSQGYPHIPTIFLWNGGSGPGFVILPTYCESVSLYR
jgi:hypothetical protein